MTRPARRPPVTSGSATAFASPGIPVTVARRLHHDFYAQATSVANVPSRLLADPGDLRRGLHAAPGERGLRPDRDDHDQTPTFTFSGSDAIGPVTFQCSIDTGTANFRACSGPGDSDTPASPLADGSYTFRVQATDAAGNSSVATRSFSVQTPSPPPPPPPETTITKGPKKTQKRVRSSSSPPADAGRRPSSASSTRASSRPARRPSRRPSFVRASTGCRSGPLGPEEPTPPRRSGSSGSSRRPEEIGAPGFEPGTSPTRTVRATRLRHAPRAPRIEARCARAVATG